MKDNKINTAAIWLRVSTDEQTTDNQRQPLLDFAASRGLEVVKTYDVTGKSAYHGAHQTDIDDALADACAGLFTHLIVWSYDRLSRQGIERTLKLVRQFQEAGVTILSLQEAGLERFGADAEMWLSMEAYRARRESEHKGERVRAARDRMKAAGEWPGGTVPFGMARVGSAKLSVAESRGGRAKVVEVLEPAAKIVRLIYSLYVDRRLGIHAIANYLNENRYPAPRNGGRWGTSTVWRILRYDYRGGVHHEHTPVKLPQVIAAGQWERAQTLLSANHRKKVSPGTHSPLQGIVRCAEPCGGTWRLTSAKPLRQERARIYCTHRETPRPGGVENYERCTIPRRSPADVAKAMLAGLREEFRDHERYIGMLERTRADLQTRIDELVREAPDVDKRVAEIKKRKDRLTYAFEMGGIEQDAFNLKIAGYKAEEKSLRERVPDHNQRHAELRTLTTLVAGLDDHVGLVRIRKEKGLRVGVMSFHPALALSDEAVTWADSSENPFHRTGKTDDQQLDDLVKRLNLSVTMHRDHMSLQGEFPVGVITVVDPPHAFPHGRKRKRWVYAPDHWW